MLPEWNEQRHFVLGILVALILTAMSYMFLIHPAEADSKQLSVKNEARKESLSKYFPDRGPPLDPLQKQLTKQNTLYKKDLAAMKSFSGFDAPDYLLPEKETRPKTYFSQEHTKTRDNLNKYASGKHTNQNPLLEFPDTLGFPQNITDTSKLEVADVPFHLLKLAMVRQLVENAADAGIEEVSEIIHHSSTRMDYRESGDFVECFPFQLTLHSNIQAFMRFLHQLKTEKRLFAVEYAEITPDDPLSRTQDTISVKIKILALRYVTPEDPLSIGRARKKTKKGTSKSSRAELKEKYKGKPLGYGL